MSEETIAPYRKKKNSSTSKSSKKSKHKHVWEECFLHAILPEKNFGFIQDPVPGFRCVFCGRLSEIDFIAKSIMDSSLTDLFDLSNIDWIAIDKAARHSQYTTIIDMFNNGLTVKQISSSLHIDESICRNVLKNGTQNGDCQYSAKEALIKTQRHAAECRKKKVRCITTDMIFESVKEAAAYYDLSPKALSGCLTGRSNSSGRIENKKLYWEYQ